MAPCAGIRTAAQTGVHPFLIYAQALGTADVFRISQFYTSVDHFLHTVCDVVSLRDLLLWRPLLVRDRAGACNGLCSHQGYR